MNVLFIDSGIGGISTLQECVKLIPNLNFIYYADDKYSPYGNLSQKLITKRLENIIDDLLITNNINIVVLACNTATANSIDFLRKKYMLPIVGIEPAINLITSNHAAVIATPSTIMQSRFKNLVNKSKFKIDVIPEPYLAKLIDNYFLYGDIFALDEIENIVKELCSQNYSTIVLGCTHYLHIKKLFEKYNNIITTDGNYGLAKQLKRLILEQNTSIKPTRKFMLSSKNKALAKKYRKIFDETLANNINVW